MAVTLPLELLQWLYKVLLNEYRDPKKTYQDVCLVLMNYPSFKTRTRVYTDEYGRSQLLLNLYGHISTPMLQLPIDIWFPFEYPNRSPIVYVLSDERYVIKHTNNVQADGLVFHPLVYQWQSISDDEVAKSYRILTLMSLLHDLLNADVPCIFRPPRMVASPSPAPQGTVPDTAAPPRLPPKPRSATPVVQDTPAVTEPVRLKSPSPPIYQEFESLSLMDQDDDPAIRSVPKLPPNPTRQEALDSLRAKFNAITQSEIPNLINKDINAAVLAANTELKSLQEEFHQIEQDQHRIDRQIEENEEILDSRLSQIAALNSELSAAPELDLDETITAPTLQHQQLYQLVAKDKSITDAIQLLTKLYELEKLQLPQMMKFVRGLAREQFLCRALIDKIVVKLQLKTYHSIDS